MSKFHGIFAAGACTPIKRTAQCMEAELAGELGAIQVQVFTTKDGVQCFSIAHTPTHEGIAQGKEGYYPITSGALGKCAPAEQQVRDTAAAALGILDYLLRCEQQQLGEEDWFVAFREAHKLIEETPWYTRFAPKYYPEDLESSGA